MFLSDDDLQIDESGEGIRTVFDLPRGEAVSLARWILEQENEDD
ncbi:hypothetical protein Javan290_0047 [Streptococcus phage Javan290]|nr:hypothetical protein Javan290_0047 [Streptococcus phage Javan290]